MKSRAGYYFSGICVVLVIAALGSYISYKSAIKHFEYVQQNYQVEASKEMQSYVSDKVAETNRKLSKLQKEESVSVSGEDYDKLGVQTIYQVEKYDVVKNSTTTDYETLPEKLVGMTREQVDEYCKDYMNKLSAKEYLAGLQSVGVTKFSKERLVVRKTYDSSKIKYKYYIIAIDGEVVVYYGDKKTVYEYTGIETKGLDKRTKNALKKGVKVKDEDELFGILENYSS